MPGCTPTTKRRAVPVATVRLSASTLKAFIVLVAETSVASMVPLRSRARSPNASSAAVPRVRPIVSDGREGPAAVGEHRSCTWLPPTRPACTTWATVPRGRRSGVPSGKRSRSESRRMNSSWPARPGGAGVDRGDAPDLEALQEDLGVDGEVLRAAGPHEDGVAVGAPAARRDERREDEGHHRHEEQADVEVGPLDVHAHGCSSTAAPSTTLMTRSIIRRTDGTRSWAVTNTARRDPSSRRRTLSRRSCAARPVSPSNGASSTTRSGSSATARASAARRRSSSLAAAGRSVGDGAQPEVLHQRRDAVVHHGLPVVGGEAQRQRHVVAEREILQEAVAHRMVADPPPEQQQVVVGQGADRRAEDLHPPRERPPQPQRVAAEVADAAVLVADRHHRRARRHREVEAVVGVVGALPQVEGGEHQRRGAGPVPAQRRRHPRRADRPAGADAHPEATTTKMAEVTNTATIVATTPRVTACGISVGPAFTARPW